MKKVRTIKYIKEVLKNYEGRYLKWNKDGETTHFVSVNCNEWYFNTRQDLLNWATSYFWNRDMHRAGYDYGC